MTQSTTQAKKKSNTIKNFKLQYFTYSFLEHSICLYIRPQSLSFYLSDKLSFTIDYRTYIRLDRKYFTFFIVQFSGCISIWGLLSRLWHFLCFSVLIPVIGPKKTFNKYFNDDDVMMFFSSVWLYRLKLVKKN